MANPTVDTPEFPAEYGSPTQHLPWPSVEERLVTASVYWFASTRPDGRPHVVPRDGMWIEGGLYYGGSPQTVHYRNITQNPHVVAHVGDGHEAIIVEGAVAVITPDQAFAERLADESYAKYPQYGQMDPGMYLGGVTVLRPSVVLAWTSFTENATRFRFD